MVTHCPKRSLLVLSSIFCLDCAFSSGESESQTKIASGCSLKVVPSARVEPKKISSMSDAAMMVFPAPVGACKETTCVFSLFLYLSSASATSTRRLSTAFL